MRKYVTFSMLILLGVGLCLSGRLAAETALEPFRRGYALEQAGRHAQALREYGQAVKLTQGALAGRIARQMGNSYYYLGLTGHAKASYEFYLRHYPQDAKVHALVERLGPAKVTATSPSRRYTHPWSATWRSLLIPGWGQWKRGDGWAALAYLGGTGTSLFSASYFGGAGNAAYDDYVRANSVDQATSLYRKTTELDGLYNASVGLIFGLYALNVADALLVTMLRNPPRPSVSVPMNTTFALAPGLDGPVLLMTMRF